MMDEPRTPDGGDAVLAAIRDLGIEYIISSPGSEWPSVWEALARQQIEDTDGPRYINCGHETLAVAMAAGYTQYTGRMQAVLLHAGLGLLQGAMPIAGSYLGEIPMLVASGESTTYGDRSDFDPGGQWYRGLSVVGGPGRWVESFTKWSGRVTSSETIYETVARAGEMAVRCPQGPAFVSVPMEVMIDPWTPRSHTLPPAPKHYPDPAAVDRVAGLISAAEYPVILTETAGRDPAAFDALVRLAQAAAIPVVEALTALYANFPRNHPLHRGYEIDPHLLEADLVLVVADKVPWYPPAAGPKRAKVVVIDEDPIKVQMEYQNLQADEYIEGSLTVTLGMLAESLNVDGSRAAARFEAHRAAHDSYVSGHEAEAESDRGKATITRAFAAAAMAKVLGEDGILVDETIVHRLPLLRHGRWHRDRSYFRSAGGLGKGIGQALGVKLAAPDRMVAVAVGDGSLLYNPFLPSVLASFEHDLPILIVVFDNASYASMKGMHLKFYPEGTSAATGVHVAVDIPGPDYAAVMEALGGYGVRVHSPDRLEAVLAEARQRVEAGQTALVDVVVP